MALLALALNKRIRPRPWTALVATFLIVAIGGLSTTAQQSANPAGNQGRRVALRDQLTYGLRATTKADLEFIDKVVFLVDQGKLPRRLVDTTFFWARERAARRSPQRRLRPMVYFQPGLVARAERIGVEI